MRSLPLVLGSVPVVAGAYVHSRTVVHTGSAETERDDESRWRIARGRGEPRLSDVLGEAGDDGARDPAIALRGHGDDVAFIRNTKARPRTGLMLAVEPVHAKRTLKIAGSKGLGCPPLELRWL
jgi:hypothetical protein